MLCSSLEPRPAVLVMSPSAWNVGALNEPDEPLGSSMAQEGMEVAATGGRCYRQAVGLVDKGSGGGRFIK